MTTNHVRGETWTFLRRRAGHRAAVEFIDDLRRSPRFDVVFVDRELEEEAVTWLRRRDERSYSFVDATSFAVMRKARIADVFCFDDDFSAAGFNVLRPVGER